jgi:hypothetical protein
MPLTSAAFVGAVLDIDVPITDMVALDGFNAITAGQECIRNITVRHVDRGTRRA